MWREVNLDKRLEIEFPFKVDEVIRAAAKGVYHRERERWWREQQEKRTAALTAEVDRLGPDEMVERDRLVSNTQRIVDGDKEKGAGHALLAIEYERWAKMLLRLREGLVVHGHQAVTGYDVVMLKYNDVVYFGLDEK